VVTVGDDTFRSIALMAVADMPLFSDTSYENDTPWNVVV
jgi:hypothetical protein